MAYTPASISSKIKEFLLMTLISLIITQSELLNGIQMKIYPRVCGTGLLLHLSLGRKKSQDYMSVDGLGNVGSLLIFFLTRLHCRSIKGLERNLEVIGPTGFQIFFKKTFN